MANIAGILTQTTFTNSISLYPRPHKKPTNTKAFKKLIKFESRANDNQTVS